MCVFVYTYIYIYIYMCVCIWYIYIYIYISASRFIRLSLFHQNLTFYKHNLHFMTDWYQDILPTITDCNLKNSILNWFVIKDLPSNFVQQKASFFEDFHEMTCLFLSFDAGANGFASFFGYSFILFLWFNLLEFIWIYFTATTATTTTTTKILAKFENPCKPLDRSITKQHLSQTV